MSKKSPQLRFEGFTDDWEERKLSEIADIMDGDRGKNYPNGDDFSETGHTLFMSATNVTKNGFKFDETQYISEEKSDSLGNGKIIEDDLILTSRGTVGNLALYDADAKRQIPFARINSGMLILRKKQNESAEFVLQYLKSLVGIKQLNLISFGSAQPQITKKDISKYKVQIPNFDEQTKIGTFFKQLDTLITLHQRKLDLLKEQRKGYLQKMFPKTGEKIPELRFAGFADDWEERKLSSMTNYKNGKSHEDKQSTSGKLELINLNSISISGGLKHSGKFIDEADDTLQKDDLVMILSDVGHGDLLGRVALIPEDDRFVLNQRVALLRPNTTADPQFLFSYINAHQYYFKAQGAGMSQLNISKGSVENFISFVPIIEEQKKIGAFYKRLDDTIALHQRKLDLLKEQKKGYLQKMFPKNCEKVPELRFEGFADDWEERKFADFIDVKSGKDYKHLNSGPIPVYGTGGYMLSVDRALSDIDAIGIGRKGTIDKPYLLKAPFWTVDTLFYAVPKQNIDLQFSLSIFKKINWKKFDESTGVPSLSKTVINNSGILL